MVLCIYASSWTHRVQKCNEIFSKISHFDGKEGKQFTKRWSSLEKKAKSERVRAIRWKKAKLVSERPCSMLYVLICAWVCLNCPVRCIVIENGITVVVSPIGGDDGEEHFCSRFRHCMLTTCILWWVSFSLYLFVFLFTLSPAHSLPLLAICDFRAIRTQIIYNWLTYEATTTQAKWFRFHISM